MSQNNPFAKLGALDQKLYQETGPKPENNNSSKQDFKYSGKPENKISSIQENKNSGIPEIQHSSIQESKNSSIQSPQPTAVRKFYSKATYRLSDAALDALSDAKNVLKRRYKLKVDLEEIVETAILEAYKDLTENEDKCILVSKYTGNPENQNS